MSGWTTLTLRGKYSRDYPYSEYDEKDPWQAVNDLIVTLQNDSRISEVGYWKSHVYAYLSTGRYDWETGEQVLLDYEPAIYDAVIIGANDTTDTGKAKYYPVYDSWHCAADEYTDMYSETQKADGTNVGAIAAATMTARHGIVAQESLQYRATGGWASGVTEHQESRGRDMSEVWNDN